LRYQLLVWRAIYYYACRYAKILVIRKFCDFSRRGFWCLIYCTNKHRSVYSVICGISCWSGVRFTNMRVGTQKFLSYASSAIFRTCYSLSVRKNCFTYVQPSRYIYMEQTIDHTDCWLATIRTGQGQATSSYSIFNLVVWRKWWRNFFFTFYKHRRKQIAAVILKPIIEVTSSTRYFYKKFSVVRQLWSCEFRIFRT